MQALEAIIARLTSRRPTAEQLRYRQNQAFNHRKYYFTVID
jgi:hypothetical protein